MNLTTNPKKIPPEPPDTLFTTLEPKTSEAIDLVNENNLENYPNGNKDRKIYRRYKDAKGVECT